MAPPPQPGQLIRLPQLADTLERVAREGRQGLYEGPVAEAIASTISAGGVPATMADVAAQQHAAEWVEPLSVGFRGREVLGMPPNCQGVVALHALGILDGLPLAAMDEAERLHHQIEAIRLGFELAIDVVGEPTPAMLEQLRQELSPDGLAAARSRISAQARPATRPQGGNSGDTSYVCAVDGEGNAVSLMTSISGLFGSGLVAGDTGVLLNNRAAQFSSQPGHPNALAPGHRPRHSILPAMVLRDGLPEFVMGVIGGNAHPQGLTQILVNALDLGMNPQQAVDAPRFKLIMQSGAVHIDPQFNPDVGHELVARGHQLGDSYGFIGFKGGGADGAHPSRCRRQLHQPGGWCGSPARWRGAGLLRGVQGFTTFQPIQHQGLEQRVALAVDQLRRCGGWIAQGIEPKNDLHLQQRRIRGGHRQV